LADDVPTDLPSPLTTHINVTPGSKVLLGSLIFIQHVNISYTFIETEVLLPFIQEPLFGHGSEPDNAACHPEQDVREIFLCVRKLLLP